MRLGLQEVHEQSPKEVNDHEEAEPKTGFVGTSTYEVQREGERTKKEDLVCLCGMTGDSVPEVYRPGKPGRRPKRIVRQSS